MESDIAILNSFHKAYFGQLAECLIAFPILHGAVVYGMAF